MIEGVLAEQYVLVYCDTGSLPGLETGVEVSVEAAKHSQQAGCRETRVCDGIDERLIPQAIPISIDSGSKGIAQLRLGFTDHQNPQQYCI